MSALFEPFTLKGVTLRNRIAVPPMCQYSAVDGVTNRWHWVHYPSIARGGAGFVIVEATGVSADGRITPVCTGLWNDGQIEGMARIAAEIEAEGSVPRHPDRPCRPQGERQPAVGRRRSHSGWRSARLGNDGAD
jgi:2,4-dienoyl-CoA reductase-like NADH-dependent reductase (Old Yellow Enzyme family)